MNSECQWYLRPLYFEDIFAGAFLILFGCIFLLLHAVIVYIFYKNEKVILILI